jgi:L-iditol 2-dehydrogenase
MKVGMYYNNSDIRVENIPEPELTENDILLKVEDCGICGSDIMEWYRIQKAPIVLGHEITGEILYSGRNVKNLEKGDKVFTTHHVPCNECHYCLTNHETACDTLKSVNNFDPGGFSEFLKVSGESLTKGTYKLPDEMNYEQGTFIEPLGTVVRGMRKINLQPGDSTLVIGTGVAGLLNIKMAKALGAGKIFAADVNPSRLEVASQYADYVINSQRTGFDELIRCANNGRLVDKVIVSSGATAASEHALQLVDKGGSILFFAVPKPEETIPVDFNYFWRNDISFQTTYGAAPLDNKQSMELIRSGRVQVDDLITHRLSLDDIAEGFNLAVKGDCLKVLIKP